MQYKNKSGILTALIFLSLAAGAQLPLVWTNQEKTTIQEYWYPGGNKDSVQLWTTQEIWHDKQGKPLLGVLTGKEGNDQRVNFRYNEQGDLVERIHRMADSTELIYTWKYKYDDKGRKIEETSFDHEEKLISQLIRVYDDQDRLTDAAMFVRRLPEYQSWQYLDKEDGLKKHDPQFLSYGPRHFYFNWSERIFLEYLNPFSLIPSEDVFQRYKYYYNQEGKMARAELFDQLRTLVEDDEFFYDGRGRVRSLKSNMPLDSATLVWDFQYGDLGEIKLSRFVNMSDQSIVQMFKTEFIMEGTQVSVQKNILVKNIRDYVYYDKQNHLITRELRDIFDALLESQIFSPDGRISEGRKYIDNEVLEVVRRYSYQP